MAKSTNSSGANLGFEDKLWAAADKLRGNMDASEYKHVVLGLIFLKYISDAFMEKFTVLKDDKHANPEDKDEYLADNIFWVPPEARWPHLQKNAKRPEIGTLVDNALTAIERDRVEQSCVWLEIGRRSRLCQHGCTQQQQTDPRGNFLDYHNLSFHPGAGQHLQLAPLPAAPPRAKFTEPTTGFEQSARFDDTLQHCLAAGVALELPVPVDRVMQ